MQDYVKDWDILVPLKEDLKNGQPFPSLPSKMATCLIVSYLDYRPMICSLL